MTSHSPGGRFSMDVQAVGADLLATMAGELDDFAAQAVIGLADHPLNVSRLVILDPASLSFIDSSGVHALVTLRDRLLGLALRNPAPLVANVLRMTGLDVWVTPPE